MRLMMPSGDETFTWASVHETPERGVAVIG
jgi:hypothetical protein